jgi:hypothetical protein
LSGKGDSAFQQDASEGKTRSSLPNKVAVDLISKPAIDSSRLMISSAMTVSSEEGAESVCSRVSDDVLGAGFGAGLADLEDADFVSSRSFGFELGFSSKSLDDRLDSRPSVLPSSVADSFPLPFSPDAGRGAEMSRTALLLLL